MGGVSTGDRFRGCLVGLAVGDALGTTLEFSPGFVRPDRRHGRRGAVRVAGGPVRRHVDGAVRPPGWSRAGSTLWTRWGATCGGSGRGTCRRRGAASRRHHPRGPGGFERTGEPYSGPTDAMSAGNGSLMRLAPVPMFFAGDAREAIDRSADSSRTTHGAVEAVDACRYFAGLLVGALRGVDKQTLLSEHYSPVEGLWDEAPLAPKIAAIAAGSFKHKQPPEIRGTGYVVDTLEAVLWAFFHTEDFREGALKVVNLGQDADTTGAIFGQIAGAHYGVESIPAEWRQRLTMGADVLSLADNLYRRASSTECHALA